MKQRIRVVAIMGEEREYTHLLLERFPSRLEEPPSWELPMGKILLGEQPEDAMVRVLADSLGVTAEHLALIDVVAASDLRTSSSAYNLFIVYRVDAPLEAIRLSPRYSSYQLVPEHDLPRTNLDEATSILLRILSGEGKYKAVDTGQSPRNASEVSKPRGQRSVMVYTDGGSRGNPGPAAIGWHIVSDTGKELARGGEFIGQANSRQAEYLAVKKAAQVARELGAESVSFFCDSLMVVSQMNGVYQVKNRDLWEITDEIDEILHHFQHHIFNHIPRSQNAAADSEVNKILDARTSKP
ncbi:reverse transcriptase-like protein [Candidatus Saccharibacteria bacterium]|nr:reverse transcriptase-like protein [Candidatus Saccharibacteria bacterium]